ncbi:MAG: V-type ATPase subunit [Candidatus Nomurabacteria bacterium]|nr:V-type ATPase subunit [Candidatus Nomurabacteria bacterium]USN88027.1 MAG: V-type ATPase subunit [Candidatus Nomurabacteria bacterium]
MKTSYIYSSSRVKALEKELLNESDVERLLEASRGVELIKFLKETYINQYLESDDIDGVLKATEKSLVEAKELITKITPEPKLLDFLWVYYDLQNLRVQLKSKQANLESEQMMAYLSRLGKYSPETLLEHIAAGTLNRLEPEFKTIYDNASKALEEKGVAAADLVIEAGYFDLAKRMVGDARDLSIGTILRLQIDLYNLKTRLRTLLVPRQGDDSWFVTGGNLRYEDIELKEQALAVLVNYGGESKWREAIELYSSEGHSTLIDARSDDYLLETVRTMSYDVFSPASLIAYFLQVQNTAKIIKTVVVGKESGQTRDFIRKQLRTIYV